MINFLLSDSTIVGVLCVLSLVLTGVGAFMAGYYSKPGLSSTQENRSLVALMVACFVLELFLYVITL